MLFYYKAKNSEGAEVTGSIEAIDQPAAVTALSDRGLWATSVSSERAESFLSKDVAFLSWVSVSVFNAFLLQLSVMIRSGVPLTESLASLETGETNRTLKKAIQNVRREVEKGNSFSDALSMHPELFDPFFVNMVRIGETGGVLEQVLIKLTAIRQRSVTLRNQILSSVTYPALLVVMVSVVMLILFGFALPRFAGVFKSASMQLPWQTKLVMDIGDLVGSNLWLFGGLGLSMMMLGVWMALTRTGRWVAGEICLRLPVFNRVVKCYMMVHISEAMGMLLNAGVPLLELLTAIEKTIAMPTARNTLTSMRNFVERGSSMRMGLENNRIFSPMALKLIETGEKTGNLDRMFEEIAAYYDDALQSSIKAVLSLLEPLLIFFMAVIVGFIIVAVILPIFQMSSMFKGV